MNLHKALTSRILNLVTAHAKHPPVTSHGETGQNDVPPDVTARILDLAPTGILVAALRPGQPLIYVNAAFERITGYSSAEALGKNCRYLQGNDRLQPEIAEMREAIRQRREVSVMIRNYRRDGALFWNKLCLAPAGNLHAEPSHYVGLMQDVTDTKETVERLQTTLQTDQLTGAMSRYAFLDQAGSLRTEEGLLLLIVKIDIAEFHDINAGYGYEAGDLLLQQVASRLKALSAVVGRLGPNEFGLARRLTSHDEAAAALEEISIALAPRYVVPGAVLNVRFAIGYTVGEADVDALTLLRRAGSALKESRSTRLRDVRRYDEESEARSRNRVRLTAELQQAMQNNEFLLAYQPKIKLATGTISGAEALLRWRHGLFGEQLPGTFIHAAEETGLILDIGAWSFRAAVAFAAEVNRERSEPLTFAVNISALELIHRDMVHSTEAVLKESGINPAWLVLELTESLMTDSSPKVLDIFKSLRSLGLGLSIDDFGTGYSSLRYLGTFPITEVKIDRSFVLGISQNAANRLVVKTIIGLGRDLGIDVVAEGVETEPDRVALCEMGCSYAQGRLFSPPVSPETFRALVRSASRTAPGA